MYFSNYCQKAFDELGNVDITEIDVMVPITVRFCVNMEMNIKDATYDNLSTEVVRAD